MYTGMLENVLRGGGRPRARKVGRKSAGKPRMVRQQTQLRGAGMAVADRDVMVQQFNHAGTVDHVTMSAAELTSSVVAPLVKQVLQAHFPNAAGHKLADVVRQRGYKVPDSLVAA